MERTHEERLLVTTSHQGESKTQIWETSRTLRLARPFDWEVTFGASKVRLSSTRTKQKLAFPATQLEQDPRIDLGNGMTVTFRKLHFATAPYLQESSQFDSNSTTVALLAFAGVGSSAVGHQAVSSAYLGMSRRRPVFTLNRRSDCLLLKPLLDGLTISRPGVGSKPLPAGLPVEFQPEELLAATLQWGVYWWRLRLVDQATPHIAFDDPDADEETQWFKKALFLGGFALTGALVMLLAREPTPEPTTPAPAQTAVDIKVERHSTAPKQISDALLASLKSQRPKAPVPVKTEPAPLAQAIPLPPVPRVMSKPIPPANSQAVPGGSGKTAKPVAAKITPAPAPVHAPLKVAPSQGSPMGGGGGGGGKALATTLKVLEDPSARLLAQNQKVLQDALGGLVAAVKNGGGAASGVLTWFGGAGDSPGRGPGLAQGSASKGMFEGGAVTAIRPTEVKPQLLPVGNEGITRLGDIAAQASVADDLDQSGDGRGQGTGRGPAGKTMLAKQGRSFIDVGSGAAEAVVQDGLTKEEVDSVIRANMAKIRYCHESAMVYRSYLDGTVVVQFTISPSGAVKSSSVQKSTLPDKKLEQCILGTVGTWHFLRPRAGVSVTVSYPFIFKTLGKGD